MFRKSLIVICVLVLSAACLSADAEEHSRGVLFFGVYTQWYGFDALTDIELKVSNAHSQGVQDFPSLADLHEKKLIVLSNVSGREFSEFQISALKSRVEDGAGLLVMGGPFTYGLGDFNEAGLTELLPLGQLEPFDLKAEKQGLCIVGAGSHPVLDNINLQRCPSVYWIHELTPAEDSTVVLKAGNYPLLILGSYGKGKVAVFAGTPMGQPSEGQVPFWEWQEWQKLLNNIVNYLTY